MTYSEFIKKYEGRAVDYDGAAGAQCVDLIKLYLKEVFGIPQFSIDNSAKNYYINYYRYPQLVNNFTKIKNSASFVPQRGDICVFGSGVGGGHGHVSIATGEGTTRYFYSYDMNWGGNECHKVKHGYQSDNFLGVLRAEDITKVEGNIFYPKCGAKLNSIVDGLASVNVDSSFSNRRKIAKANSISGYIGTAKQNTQMLDLLKKGKLKRGDE